MVIEQTNSEVIFRISNKISVDKLQDVANFFKYKEITKNLRVSQKQVDSLVKEIKKGRWEKHKVKFGL
jgi:hypothetical protein